MKKRFSAGGILLASFFSPLASAIECISIAENTTIEVKLRHIEKFNNCFSLSNLPQNTPINFVAYSRNKVRNKISLYDLGSSSSVSYLAEYDSDVGAANAFSTNTTNKTIGFRVLPTTYLDTDKNISVSLLTVNGTGQVLIELMDLDATTNPYEGSYCDNRDGARICYDEK